MKHSRRILLILVILLALGLLVYALFHLLGPAADPPEVLLPSPAESSADPDTTGGENALTLAAVTPDTVLQVLAELSRADSYARSITLETAWSDGSSTETMEVWARGSSLRIRSGEKNLLLTDGRRYLWYADDARVLETEEAAGTQFDRYQRMITYEDLLRERPKIDEAAYVDLDGEPCIYVEYVSGSFGYVNRLYISVSCGLLMRAETWDGETCVLCMTSGPVQISTPEDSVFAPPDAES